MSCVKNGAVIAGYTIRSVSNNVLVLQAPSAALHKPSGEGDQQLHQGPDATHSERQPIRTGGATCKVVGFVPNQ